MHEKKQRGALRDAFDLSKGRAKYATIRERIVSSAKVDGIHLCQLIAAMLIASIGINTNSTEAIIGAMLICPLMGSVLAIAYGMTALDMYITKHAVVGMMLQCAICLVTSTLYFFFSPLSGETSALLNNSAATIWDVLIALAGGFAGALGISRRQEPNTLLAGVAVATALMPPLCSTGYGLAHANFVLAASAFYEFLINVVFIAFGAALVLMLLRLPLRGDIDGDGKVSDTELSKMEEDSRMLRRRIVIGLLLFAIPSAYFTMQVVQRSLASGQIVLGVDVYNTETVTQELAVVCPGFLDYRVGVEESLDESGEHVQRRLVATVVTRRKLSQQRRDMVEALIKLHVSDLDEVMFELGEG